jgi:replicative DNA helicase
MSTASLKDKIPPHNLEAEQATLGAVLLDWDAVGSVIVHLRSESFYSLQHQTVLKQSFPYIIRDNEVIFLL